MGLRINTNIASLAASRALNATSADQQKAYQRLSSGQRITSAGDDAAGLSISENLRAQVRSMSQAERNANDGISFAQVAEGGLTEIGNTMVRLRELAVQAASDTIGDKERSYINEEVKSMLSEVNRIASVTAYNGTPLLNGKAEKSNLEFQVGIRNDESDRIRFSSSDYDVTTSALGVDGMDFSSVSGARKALDKVDAGMDRVFAARARLGAAQNKLQSTVNNLNIAKENISQARSRIADTDVATETSELIKNNILQSAGISVLAQANSSPQNALKLM
jgi:flagellin